MTFLRTAEIFEARKRDPLDSALVLAFLLFTMVGNGMRGFTRTEIALKVDFPASPLLLDPANITDEALANANLPMVTSTAPRMGTWVCVPGNVSTFSGPKVRPRRAV